MVAGRALYPTDFSAGSIEAIDKAVTYCLSLNKELIILYAYRLIADGSKSVSYSLKKDMDTRAEAIFKTVENERLIGLSLSYQLLSEVGFTDDRIAHHAESDKFDTILLCKALYAQLENKIVLKGGVSTLYELPVMAL